MPSIRRQGRRPGPSLSKAHDAIAICPAPEVNAPRTFAGLEAAISHSMSLKLLLRRAFAARPGRLGQSSAPRSRAQPTFHPSGRHGLATTTVARSPALERAPAPTLL